MIDVVIISNAKTDELKSYTQEAINTSGERCIVVEGSRAQYDCDTIYMNEHPFNYNRALNEGITWTTQQYIALCNNDIIFHPGWQTITKYMKQQKCLSASPICPVWHPREHHIRPKRGNIFGHQVGKHIAGWCIIIDRLVLERIGGKLDETYDFWCSDNVYAQQIMKAGIRHFLCTYSQVTHRMSATYNTLDDAGKHSVTVPDVKKWNRINNDNKFNWGK